ALLAFQCPVAPCPYAVKMAGSSTGTELVFLSDDQCQRVIGDNNRKTLDIIYDCLGLGKSNGLSLWHFLIFGTCLGQRVACTRWQGHLQRHLRHEKQRLETHKRLYVER
ncbi:unnamed protein product, partial [Prorocentrum cordatum]